MATLDEKSLRKPEFNEDSGEFVTLADGQSWLFPIPYRVFELDDEGLKPIRRLYVAGRDDYPDPMAKITDESTEEEVMAYQIEAIRYLLTMNYDLQPPDFKHLIRLGSYAGNTPPDVAEMSDTLRDIVYGRARPKSPSSATSDVG